MPMCMNADCSVSRTHTITLVAICIKPVSIAAITSVASNCVVAIMTTFVQTIHSALINIYK